MQQSIISSVVREWHRTIGLLNLHAVSSLSSIQLHWNSFMVALHKMFSFIRRESNLAPNRWNSFNTASLKQKKPDCSWNTQLFLELQNSKFASLLEKLYSRMASNRPYWIHPLGRNTQHNCLLWWMCKAVHRKVCGHMGCDYRAQQWNHTQSVLDMSYICFTGNLWTIHQ